MERNCLQDGRTTNTLRFDDEQVGENCFQEEARYRQEGKASPKARIFRQEGQVRVCEEDRQGTQIPQ